MLSVGGRFFQLMGVQRVNSSKKLIRKKGRKFNGF